MIKQLIETFLQVAISAPTNCLDVLTFRIIYNQLNQVLSGGSDRQEVLLLKIYNYVKFKFNCCCRNGHSRLMISLLLSIMDIDHEIIVITMIVYTQ